MNFQKKEQFRAEIEAKYKELYEREVGVVRKQLDQRMGIIEGLKHAARQKQKAHEMGLNQVSRKMS